jgi:hypothetical protein
MLFVLREKEKEEKVGERSEGHSFMGGGWNMPDLIVPRSDTFPHLLDNRVTDGGKFFSPKHWQPFTPQEDSWYSFLLEAESTPGPYCGWKV